MAVDTEARHSDGAVETCSSTTDVQDFLLTYSGDSTLSQGDPLRLSLAVSFATRETAPGTAAVIDLLKIIRDLASDAHLLNIPVNSIACCQKLSNREVKRCNQ